MKKIEKEAIIINYAESLEELAIKSMDVLIAKIPEYLQLFNIEKLDDITVNYFDNVDEFRKVVYEETGKKLSNYVKGINKGNTIIAYTNPEEQMNGLYYASHSLFNILYMKYILKNNHDNRIVWYDEGMAQLFSGEKEGLNLEEKFKKYYFKIKETTKSIPNMNLLKHGDEFWNENYNGFALSYLSVKYLSETMTKKLFRNLMQDFDKIKLIGNNILNEMFNYYDKKFSNETI